MDILLFAEDLLLFAEHLLCARPSARDSGDRRSEPDRALLEGLALSRHLELLPKSHLEQRLNFENSKFQ